MRDARAAGSPPAASFPAPARNPAGEEPQRTCRSRACRFRQRHGKGRAADPHPGREAGGRAAAGHGGPPRRRRSSSRRSRTANSRSSPTPTPTTTSTPGRSAASGTRSGRKIAELAKGRVKPEVVATAPCKEVILKGDDVDLTRLPLFLHHDRDGHAYTNDNLVVTKDPDTRRDRLGHLPRRCSARRTRKTST